MINGDDGVFQHEQPVDYLEGINHWTKLPGIAGDDAMSQLLGLIYPLYNPFISSKEGQKNRRGQQE